MKTIFAFLFILVFVTGCQQNTDEFTADEMSTVKSEVDAAADAWWTAWAAVNLEDGMSYVSNQEHAIWIGDDETLAGFTAMRDAWKPWAESLQSQEIEFTDLHTIPLSETLAYTIREYEVVATQADSTVSPQMNGVETLVWQKENGAWKVLFGHESTRKMSWTTRLETDEEMESDE